MTFLLLNYINISLLLYLIYSLVIISLVILTNKIMNKSISPDATLSDDQYFVLNNNYNVETIFYFITYKLYHNRIILLDHSKSSFYLNTSITCNLSAIELEVSKLYKKPFSPTEFKPQLVNENIFKNYFTSTYNSLISHKFIKSKKFQVLCKVLFSLGLFFTLIPGIVILISFYFKDIFLPKIIVSMIINSFLYILLLKNTVLNIVTSQGIRANISYKKKNFFTNTSFRNDSYATKMKKFLLQSCYMYYYDEDDDGEDDGND